jgi:AraC-like DNA-binding protein
MERLSPHDALISPVLEAIRARVRDASCSEAWLEESLLLLLERLFQRESLFAAEIARLPAVRAATRRELYRRLCRARDFIDSCYRDQLDLSRIAAIACLSPYHLLRLFRTSFGCTPHQYLTTRRVDAAAAALGGGARDLAAVADAAGFESRSAFFRNFKRRFGVAPSTYAASHRALH